MIDGREQSKRGLFWMGSAAILARIVDVAATLAVVGLLTREQMGLAALALSACAILESLSGMGIGSALVQAKELGAAEKSSLFWLTSGIGWVLGGLLALAGPALGYFYGEPELAPLTAASGVKLLLIGMSVVPMQLLGKDLKFKELGAVHTLSSLAEGVIKIALAFAGAGAWALVAGNVGRGVALLVALWCLCEFRPALHCALAETRRFMRFGLHVAGSSLLFQVYKNADYFIVGKFLGIEPLGLYRVAFDVAMQPTDAINAVMGRVAFPVYSRLNHDLPALRAAFASNTRSLLLMVAPVAAFVYFAAPELLALIGEGRWMAAVPAVHILVVAGFVRAATVMFAQVYMAIGRPGLSGLDSAVTLGLLIIAFGVGLSALPELGILAVCYAWLAVYPLLLAGHLYVSHRYFGLSPASYLRAMADSLGALVALAVGLWVVGRSGAVPSGWPMLVVMVITTLLIHYGYLRWALGVRFKDLIPRRLPPARASNDQTQ